MSRRAVGEVVAVVLTGLTFLFFENVLHRKLEFLVPCVVGWTAYLLWRVRRDRSLMAAWGLRIDNLGPAATASGAFFLAAGIGIFLFRLARGWSPLPASALAVFALYPVWALLQQFMVQALVTRNLRDLGLARAIVVPAAAVAFGLAHLPDWRLSALCTGAGAVWAILFLRTPNLLPIALTHAWLGALSYYWILERDPWREMFP